MIDPHHRTLVPQCSIMNDSKRNDLIYNKAKSTALFVYIAVRAAVLAVRTDMWRNDGACRAASKAADEARTAKTTELKHEHD